MPDCGDFILSRLCKSFRYGNLGRTLNVWLRDAYLRHLGCHRFQGYRAKMNRRLQPC
jgi:hypothetical protein